MAPPLKPVPAFSLAGRRTRNATLLLLAAILVIVVTRVLALSLSGSQRFTGWTLYGSMVVLAAYGMRKKLPAFPLGSASAWLQLHLYLGLATILLFVLHARIPQGPLEGLLAFLFLAVAGSGVVGIVLARLLPREISVRGEPVLFDRIPRLRRELAERAEAVVIACAAQSDVRVLSEHYLERLVPYFAGRRNFLSHLIRSGRPREALLEETSQLGRYLDAGGRSAVQELEKLIVAKDRVDFEEAAQLTLRLWLFVHVPLTWVLLLAGGVHALVARSFHGGAG